MESKKILNREEILEQALKNVTHDSDDYYGEPEDNFGIISDLWTTYINGYFGSSISVSPEDVAVMMCLFKIGRMAGGDFNPDSYIDLAGYAACAGEVAGRSYKAIEKAEKGDLGAA